MNNEQMFSTHGVLHYHQIMIIIIINKSMGRRLKSPENPHHLHGQIFLNTDFHKRSSLFPLEFLANIIWESETETESTQEPVKKKTKDKMHQSIN